jgi:hypothetical protein
MNILFSTLSAAYIAGIFLFADSPVVSDVAPFNPYSILHIPLYGILTFLLVLSFSPYRSKVIYRGDRVNPINPTNSTTPTNPINLSRETRPAPCGVETTTSGSLFHWDPRNLLVAGLIALVVAIADEIHQAYVPGRDASVTDVLLDVIGIGLCLFLIHRIEQVSGFSKIAGFLRRIT